MKIDRLAFHDESMLVNAKQGDNPNLTNEWGDQE